MQIKKMGLLQTKKSKRFYIAKEVNEVVWSYPTLCDPIDYSLPGSCPWDFPGKNSRVGCHFLLQGIFLTQGWNPGSLAAPASQEDFLPLEPDPCAT